MRGLLPALIMLLISVHGAAAWEPGERLSDPAQEARARAITSELRCMVCQNQSIDDSDAELARDLRLLVRERIVAGDDDEQILQFIVSRYGEFALLRPRVSLRNAVLWATPAALLAAGALFLFLRRRRSNQVVPASLSSEEQSRLDRILGDRR